MSRHRILMAAECQDSHVAETALSSQPRGHDVVVLPRRPNAGPVESTATASTIDTVDVTEMND